MHTPEESQSAVEVASRRERRQAPRVEILSAVQGEVDGAGPVTLVNVSRGGLLIASAIPMVQGEVHELAFDADGVARGAFPAEVVHVLRGSCQGTTTFYVGLRLLAPTTEQQRHAIEHLMTLGGD